MAFCRKSIHHNNPQHSSIRHLPITHRKPARLPAASCGNCQRTRDRNHTQTNPHRRSPWQRTSSVRHTASLGIAFQPCNQPQLCRYPLFFPTTTLAGTWLSGEDGQVDRGPWAVSSISLILVATRFRAVTTHLRNCHRVTCQSISESTCRLST
jgi:hypothetical protein